ncbi:MAG: hypothetical protein QM711_08320 [Micropruina sp.]|uniref:hypothetical protein n=1 Tax=Micropruina sp. TaxID=2737536 RepID=UPI0039E355C8
MTLTTNVRRIAAGALAAAALGVAAATNAHAVSTSGCTATPLTPEYAYTQSNGVKVLNYKIAVSCSSGRTAYITQERWEEDDWPNGDDHLGTSTFSARGTTTLNNYRTLVDGEIGQEEVYQKIRFYVVSDNGVVSAWTGWHNSAVRSFYN